MRIASVPDTGLCADAVEDEALQQVYYEIVQAQLHPVVNMYKPVKTAILSASGARVFTRFQRRYGKLAAILFLVGLVPSAAMFFVPARIGRPLAVLASALELPIMLIAVMSLRLDMVRVLVRTYEFWFFSTMSVAGMFSMGWYLRDMRSVQVGVIWIGNMFVIVADANVHGLNRMHTIMLVSVIYNIILVVFVLLELIEETHSFRVFRYGAQCVKTEDVVSTAFSAVIYLQVRSIYRKRMKKKRVENAQRAIHCASYRCKVKLRQLRSARCLSLLTPNAITVTYRPAIVEETVASPMEYVKIDRVFDARHTICGHRLSFDPWCPYRRFVVKACGVLGLGLNVSLFIYLNYVPDYPQIASGLALVAFGCSAVFCLACFALYNPALLRHLCFSFDFFFLSFQLVAMHISACDVFYWDPRAIVLLTSLVWTHWVLTIDALMPLARNNLGFQLWYCAPVLLSLLVGQVLFMYETSGDTKWNIRDRTIFTLHALNRSIDVRVMPLLFTRVWIMLIWECRVLWRIYYAQATDLIIVHGAVALNLTRIAPRLSHMRVMQSDDCTTTADSHR
ncbi:hypothetical protein Poli38472_003445 [Pythium oligandrum]|uniref:Uncharacterized protein n=1 Tax=Pythium oligandrum TaxID=41045 RepID=A0A8K1C6U3_PYTOL|nr:hypothetical protein Poli38472_003445 [Pythium oligandrum]|eukprot:TMW57520.1 hypothetical protein Poli38472_003445 [Pythium oligandrum]